MRIFLDIANRWPWWWGCIRCWCCLCMMIMLTSGIRFEFDIRIIQWFEIIIFFPFHSSLKRKIKHNDDSIRKYFFSTYRFWNQIWRKKSKKKHFFDPNETNLTLICRSVKLRWWAISIRRRRVKYLRRRRRRRRKYFISFVDHFSFYLL